MLAAGTTMGPYRILAPLGAGGMGEVYRARDIRLGRDVAVKVIPAELARDHESLKRFEREARAVGALAHPNVVAIHDVGKHDGTPFVVMELIEGETLRERLKRGPIPFRQALDLVQQIARGLAAAHAKGIVHRDLKPENLVLTQDGRAKLLDFGLAKLTRPEALGSSPETSMFLSSTQTGAILGSAGYMAPEQVRGQAADQRADLFALGAILYEMLTGKRAFQGASSVETLNAILNEEPPSATTTSKHVPPGVEKVIRQCLEKEPSRRFESAHDLGLALEAAAEATSSTLAPSPISSARVPRLRSLVLMASALAVTGAGFYLWGHQGRVTAIPDFTRVTYANQKSEGLARFSPDGQTVIYSATSEDRPRQLYSRRLADPGVHLLGLGGAWVVATAGSEMAVVLPNKTFARVGLDGGTPREIVDHVSGADWARDGSRFAVVREVGDSQQLEWPIGKVLMSTTGAERIGGPRLSPGNDLLVLVHRAAGPETPGEILLIDRSGRKRALSKGWLMGGDPVWAPDGREVWFTGSRVGIRNALYAVSLSGKERFVARLPGSLYLQDISKDGRLLLTQHDPRFEMRGRMRGDTAERNLSWLGQSWVGLISPDGSRLVFQDSGEGGAWESIYLRRNDESLPVRLADSELIGVSPDWTWLLTRFKSGAVNELRMVPIGPGESKPIPRGPIHNYIWACCHPDGKRVVILGNEVGRPTRLFIQELPDGLPRAFGPEGVAPLAVNPMLLVTPDGGFCTSRPPGSRVAYVLYPLDGGPARAIPGLLADDEPITWSNDGRFLFVSGVPEGTTTPVVRVDTRTGRRQTWLELSHPDRGGTYGAPFQVSITPDGQSYLYCYNRTASELYVVSGLK